MIFTGVHGCKAFSFYGHTALVVRKKKINKWHIWFPLLRSSGQGVYAEIQVSKQVNTPPAPSNVLECGQELECSH